MESFFRKHQNTAFNIATGLALTPAAAGLGALYSTLLSGNASAAALFGSGLFLLLLPFLGYQAAWHKLVLAQQSSLQAGAARSRLPVKILFICVVHGLAQISMSGFGLILSLKAYKAAGLSDTVQTAAAVIMGIAVLAGCQAMTKRIYSYHIAQKEALQTEHFRRSNKFKPWLIDLILFVWALTGSGLLWGLFGEAILKGTRDFSFVSILLIGGGTAFLFLVLFMPWSSPYSVAGWIKRREDAALKETLVLWSSLAFVFLLLFMPMLYRAHRDYTTLSPLNPGDITAGTRVYAYWELDSWYYYGIIQDPGAETVQVQFYDGTDAALDPAQVYAADINPALWLIEADLNGDSRFEEPGSLTRLGTEWESVLQDGTKSIVQARDLRMQPRAPE